MLFQNVVRLYSNCTGTNKTNKPSICFLYSLLQKSKFDKLGSYLAGLIEGDGTIHVSQTNTKKQGYIRIYFSIKDLPLAQKLAEIFLGTINYNKNCLELNFYKIDSLMVIVCMINGQMRTPKIEALHRLIDYLNNKDVFLKKVPTDFIFENKLPKLPLNDCSLGSNSWLSGFLDSDAVFYINGHLRLDKLSGKDGLTKLSIFMALSQRAIYHNNNWENKSYFPIMSKIVDFLELNKVYFRERKERINNQVLRSKEQNYTIKVVRIESIKLLIEYLDKYPLYSSKFLDYLDWKQMHLNRKKDKFKKLELFVKLKARMNTKRTVFCWDHLNGISPKDKI